MSIQTTYTAAKETKRGTRIWIEGQKLSLSGFTPDALYTVLYDGVSKRITLALDPVVGSKRVTKSTRNGKDRPIIDLQSKMVDSVFSGGDRLRVTFNHGQIIISQHHEVTSQESREQLFSNLKEVA